MTVQTQENDVRVKILDTLLTCPHRNVKDILPLHSQMEEQDPIFYAHLGVWSQDNTVVKDHNELFVAKMFLSSFPDHREAAYNLIQKFPPYRVNKVIDHIKGKSSKSKGTKVFEERFGGNLPRIFKSAVEKFLREREADQNWFDSCVLSDKNAMKSLYCRCRIAPGNAHVRAVLFDDGEVEPNSKYGQFKVLVKEEDPTKQAELIVTHGIPYTTALGAVKKVTPSVFVALINAMTPQEVLVNLNNMQKRGAFDNKEVKELIDAKLKEAKKDKRVDILKAKQASENVKGLSDEIKAEIASVTDDKLKDLKITRSTGLLIDKSGSMERAIEVAKQIGALISSRVENKFHCYAFDRNAINVPCNSPNLSDWENIMRGINANGGTSIGAPLEVMLRREENVEQFVIVSDFDERNAPYFKDSYVKYAEKFGHKPSLVMVRTPGPIQATYNTFIKQVEELGIDYDVFTIDNTTTDYYSLPNLLIFLTKKSKFELVQEILEIPLPKRA